MPLCTANEAMSGDDEVHGGCCRRAGPATPTRRTGNAVAPDRRRRCAGQATPAPETGTGSAKPAPLVPSAATTSAHSGTIMHQRHQSGDIYGNFFFLCLKTVRPMLHNEISMLNRRQWTFGAHQAPSRRLPGAHFSEWAPRAPSAPPAAPTGNLSPRLGS